MLRTRFDKNTERLNAGQPLKETLSETHTFQPHVGYYLMQRRAFQLFLASSRKQTRPGGRDGDVIHTCAMTMPQACNLEHHLFSR